MGIVGEEIHYPLQKPDQIAKGHDRLDGAVFLDRDGTINVDVNYLSSPDEVEFIPRSIDAIRELNALGLRVFVITNQSGIARGLLTEDAMHAVHERMNALLALEGARIDDFFFCPHHPDAVVAQYRTACACRKPEPGMLREAARKHGVSLAASFMIGDKGVDMLAGKAAGTVCIQVATGYGTAERREAEHTRDYFTGDLFEAVQIVKSIIYQRRLSHE